MNKKSWKELYSKCNHNKYSQVTKVLQTYTLKSNIKNLINNYGIAMLICIMALLVLLFYTFKSNLIIVLYCMILLSLMFLMTIFYSTYKITLKEDKIITRINLQDSIIQYDKLNNIYLSRERVRVFFIPIYTYNLKITYFIGEEKINIITFPVVMLNKEEVNKFFKCFEVKSFKNQDKEIEKENIDRINTYKAIGIVIGIIFIILFIVSIILYMFK